MQRQRTLFFFAFFSCCAVAIMTFFSQSLTAQATQNFESYRGIRQMAMGGAAIAVVNDETSLLLNPAGLGKLRDYIITIADPEIDIGAKTQAILGTNVTTAFDPQKTLDALNKGFNDRPLYLRAQVFPSLVVPNFGIGVFKKYEVAGEVDSVNHLYRYQYFNETALVLGYNFRFWDGRIKIGFSGRMTDRAVANKVDLDPSATNLSLESLLEEGFGVGVDGGLLLSFPWSFIPTLAAVYRDIGNTQYNINDGMFFNTNTRPESTMGSLDVALAVFPIIGKRSRSSFTLEYRDILTANVEKDPHRRYHGGVEFNFSDALFLRAGYNQRYFTYGLEFSMANYQFQAASYGEEIGTTGQRREERHYNFKFAYRF